MTHQQIIELMQSSLGREIDDRIEGVNDRRSMLNGVDSGTLFTLLNWVGSFHPGQIFPAGSAGPVNRHPE